MDRVALNLEEDHKTVANLRARGAFTLAIPGVDTLEESDFFGIASSNKMADKFERTGLTATKSAHVDAPIVDQYPVTLECTVEAMEDEPYGLRVLGKIVNTIVDERVLNDEGKVDMTKVGAFAFDQVGYGYYALGEKVGQAWKSGTRFMK